MQVNDLVQYGNTLRAKFSAPAVVGVYTTTDFVISGLVVFRARIMIFQINIKFLFVFLIKIEKIFESDNLTYAVKFDSQALGISERVLLTDDTTWRQMYDGDSLGRFIDVNVSLDVSNINIGLFASLHSDTELTDFELRGKNGSVHVHKTVMAALSPVMKTMLSGQWKESNTGIVDVTNTTKETLEQLKDYMYLQKLPETGVEQLAILASYYMMSDLKDRCAVKLLSNLTADNATELLEFAMKYKIDKLMLAILESVHKESILVKDIEKKCHVQPICFDYY